MRRSQQICLSIATVLAAMMIGPPAAGATEPVEFIHEQPFGVPCSPCVMELAGESHLNFFGIRVSTCSDGLTLEIYHDGTGHLSYGNVSHDSGGTCTRIACNGVGEAAGEAEFDALSSEEIGPGRASVDLRFCLDAASNPNATGTHCTTPVDVSESATNHHYVLEVHATCGPAEFEGAWALVGGDNLEVRHL